MTRSPSTGPARPLGGQLATLDDAGLPAFPALLHEPWPLVEAALGPAGGTPRRLEPRQVTWRPGRSLTVRYDVQVAWPSGAETDEMLVATTGRLPPGGLVLESGDAQVAVWRVPHDPWLPGLTPITDPGVVGRLLDDLDVPAGPLTHRLVAYRPGRRAVVQVTRGSMALFVKVVRPDRADALHQRHLALADSLPVPRSLGVDPTRGLVVLQGLGGTTLRRQLLAGVTDLPPPATLPAVSESVTPPPDGRRAPGWRAGEWAELLRRLRPSRADALDRLAAELDAVEASLDGPLVPVHGDLHDAQLLVRGGDLVGVLDVDTHALGRRVDDLATLVGHLSTLALTSPRRRAIEAYAADVLAAADRVVAPAALRHAVASVVLALASGPFRVLEPGWSAATDARIALARRWADAARRTG